MKTNTRLKAPSLSTRLEFERAIDDLARTTVALRHLEAKRDHQLQKIRADWEPDVQEAKGRVDALMMLVEKYAEEHRDEILPTKVKSAETPLAWYGFRLGQPTLKLLNRSWTWEKVITAIKDTMANVAVYVRTREEPDKDALKQLPAEQLASIGCRVDQAETFFVEPKEQPTELAKAS